MRTRDIKIGQKVKINVFSKSLKETDMFGVSLRSYTGRLGVVLDKDGLFIEVEVSGLGAHNFYPAELQAR